MAAVKMAKCSVVVPGKNRYCRILGSFAIFTAEIVFECVRSSTEKAQSVPASCAGVRSQGWKVRRGNDGQIDVLCQVVGDSIDAIDHRSAHRARLRLFFPVHK